jgi:serine/threonine-protein kinase
MADPREGKVLQGRYRILSLLAEGGMGVVYKAERVGIGRSVVVKFLHAILSDKPGIVDRFEREARATARLNHPHCVGLIDFGIDDGSPYLVMEYIEGKTLADLLDHGPVRGERAVDIIRQILAGLEHAHDRGILHRDLKPANVMIIEVEGYKGDFVKILDFGLAKLAWPGEDKRDVTVEGIAIGTPGYMSPEQAAGVPSDRRSDIYCSGALLYHLVTGTKAFEGDDVRSVLRRHREETPASPREIKPTAGISRELEDVIEKAMQRDPGKRYQAAQDMVTALLKTPEARRGPPPPPSGATTIARAATPTSIVDGETTRADPTARARRRGGSSGALWGVTGLVAGAVAAVVAVVYSPFGDFVRRVMPGEHADKIARETPKPVEVKPVDPIAKPQPIMVADMALAVLPTGVVTPPPPTLPATPPEKNATADAAPAPSEEDDEDSPAGKDDGSNEDDRQAPAPPAAAPRREAPPQIKTLNDVRALERKGDKDTALVGLYRLRRMKQSPAKGSEIAMLIGNLYFERKWWTDALREYRFAITLDGKARRNEVLVTNSVHALNDRSTYWRARRLILDYIGRTAAPALKKAVKLGPTPTLRRRSQKVLATLESKSYRPHR